MKVCFKCSIEKPLKDFYKHSQMKDGRLNKCKDCTKRDSRDAYFKNVTDLKWVIKERKRQREKSRRLGYYEKWSEEHRNTRADVVASKKLWLDRNPEKRRAHILVKNAIRSGELVKEPCEQCGSLENIEAHHDDYARPLDVKWLCVEHHNEYHVKMRELEAVRANAPPNELVEKPDGRQPTRKQVPKSETNPI